MLTLGKAVIGLASYVLALDESAPLGKVVFEPGSNIVRISPNARARAISDALRMIQRWEYPDLCPVPLSRLDDPPQPPPTGQGTEGGLLN